MGRSVVTGTGEILAIRPGDAGEPPRWWWVGPEGAMAGDGPLPAVDPARHWIAFLPPASAIRITALDLKDMTAAQARAAGRLLIADSSIEPIDQLHVAVAGQGHADGTTAVAIVRRAEMAQWLNALQACGIDPDVIVPAASILPEGEQGYLRADLLGETVLRGEGAGFGEDVIAAMITAGQPVTDIAIDAAGLTLALRNPAINLRQGDFAKLRRWKVEAKAVRRLAIMAAAIPLVLLATALVELARLELAIAATDRGTAAAVRSALPRAAAITNPEAQLDAELARFTGGGIGFPPTAAALFNAVQSVTDIDLAMVQFGEDGRLRATISGASADQIAAFEKAMTGQGLIVEPAEMEMVGTRPSGDIVVRGQ